MTTTSELIRACAKAARKAVAADGGGPMCMLEGCCVERREAFVRAVFAAAAETPLPWEGPVVQAGYETLCNDCDPPNPEEHWEGYVTPRIFRAMCRAAVREE
jgi:hypothetical protein